MIRIREFEPTDGERLRALWTAAGFRLISDDDAGLARFAARNPGLSVVAEEGTELVGSTMGAWDGRRGWLYHVTVAQGHRRQGLASELVTTVEERLRALGCVRVQVLVETANQGAFAFWTKQGYELRDSRQLGKSL